MNTNEQYEISVTRIGANDELTELLSAVESSPTEFLKLRLATALFRAGKYAELIELCGQISQDSCEMPQKNQVVTRLEALRQHYFAIKRSRHVYEEEARQIPGRHSFRVTMDAYETVLRMMEDELSIEAGKA